MRRHMRRSFRWGGADLKPNDIAGTDPPKSRHGPREQNLACKGGMRHPELILKQE